MGGQRHPATASPPGMSGYRLGVGPRAGLEGRGKSPATGNRFTDRPVRDVVAKPTGLSGPFLYKKCLKYREVQANAETPWWLTLVLFWSLYFAAYCNFGYLNSYPLGSY